MMLMVIRFQVWSILVESSMKLRFIYYGVVGSLENFWKRCLQSLRAEWTKVRVDYQAGLVLIPSKEGFCCLISLGEGLKFDLGRLDIPGLLTQSPILNKDNNNKLIHEAIEFYISIEYRSTKTSRNNIFHCVIFSYSLYSKILVIFLQQMGNDGGDIPGRKQLVRDRVKVQVATAQSIAIGRSRFCNLTKQPLSQPLAICRLGYIYNYQNILSSLARKQLPDKYAYIKKLSDIRKVIIQRTIQGSQYYIACPITKLEYNGLNKFVAFWDCGHVVSKKALKEVKLDKKACVVCEKPCKSEDFIDLNLQAEVLEVMRRVLIEKKKKKQKKAENSQIQKVKTASKDDMHIGAMDRLSGQFRDVIRGRQNFKDLFQKQDDEWRNVGGFQKW